VSSSSSKEREEEGEEKRTRLRGHGVSESDDRSERWRVLDSTEARDENLPAVSSLAANSTTGKEARLVLRLDSPPERERPSRP